MKTTGVVPGSGHAVRQRMSMRIVRLLRITRPGVFGYSPLLVSDLLTVMAVPSTAHSSM
jgi:hypothetical protein